MVQYPDFSILEAPSNLGISESGVEQLSTALRQAGFYHSNTFGFSLELFGRRSVVAERRA